MYESNITTIFLTLVSACGYVAATYFMKLWGRLDAVPVIALITAALIVAVAAEIIVLKSYRFGQVYFIILAVECVLVAVFASLVLGERYSVHELAGLAIIVCGVAVFQMGEDAPVSDSYAEAADVKPSNPR